MSSRKKDKEKKAACPVCGKAPVPDYAPFCSKRCADIDLHRWLTGSYAIPAVEEESGAEEVEAGEE